MKQVALITMALTWLVTNAQAAQLFDKRTDKPANLATELKSSNVKLEGPLQKTKMRSKDQMRVLLGTPLNTKSVGPAMQAEWSYRLSESQPVIVTGGVGYMIETKDNVKSEPRNFHHVPLFANIGYQPYLTKAIRLNVSAGPSVRHTFERGFTPSQSQNTAYGDLLAQIGAEYEWSETLSNSGRSLGLRANRYFGLSEKAAASQLDSVYMIFSFDL